MHNDDFVPYWITNIGIVYFKDAKVQTSNLEEAKKFKTEKAAKDFLKKQFGGWGYVDKVSLLK